MRYCIDNLRRLLLLFALLPGALLLAQEEALEVGRIEDGLAAAARLDRPVLVLLLDQGSPASTVLAESLASEDGRRMTAPYVVVRLDATVDRVTADRYMVQELPAGLLLDGTGKVRARREGLRSLAHVRELLETPFALGEGSGRVGELLAKLGGKTFPKDGWQELATAMGQDAMREAVREAILARKPMPRKELVALLSAPRLAVRTGALDLLEEAAGDDFGFDPWQKAVDNAEPLRLWQEWAARKDDGGRFSALSDAQIERLLSDVLTGDRSKAGRARERLVRAGASTLAAITRYTNDHPGLKPAYHLRLLELRYGTMLARCPDLDGARVASQIVFGNVNRQLEAVRSLRFAGSRALPILRELLQAKHSLVRETAADALGQIGENHAVALLAEHVKGESDVDVLVTMASRLGKIRTKRSHATLCELATQPKEDVVNAALRALCEFNRLVPLPDQVVKLLGDGRWRVRTAALGTVVACGNAAQRTKVLELVTDRDSFVQNTATKLLPLAVTKKQLPQLRELFRAKEAARPALVAAFAGLHEPLDDELLRLLETKTTGPVLRRVLALWQRGIEEFLEEMEDWGESRKKLSKKRKSALREAENKYLALVGRLTRHGDAEVQRAAVAVLARAVASDEAVPETLDEPLLDLSPELRGVLLARSGVTGRVRSAVLKWRRGQTTATTPATGPSPLRELTNAFLGSPAPMHTLADLQRAFLGDRVTATPEQPRVPIRVRLYQLVENSFGKLPPGSDSQLAAALLLVAGGNEKGLAILEAGFDQLSASMRTELGLLPRALPATEGARRLFGRLLAASDRYPRRGLSESLAKAAVTRQDWEAVLLDLARQPATDLSAGGLVDAWDDSSRAVTPATKAAGQRLAKGLLADSNPSEVRVAGMFILSQTSSRRTVLATSKKLRKDADPYVRLAAWQALLARQREQFEEELGTLAADPSPVVRRLLAKIVQRELSRIFLGPKQETYASWRGMGYEAVPLTVPLLQQLAKDADPKIRAMAMLTLDQRDLPPVGKELLASLRELPREGGGEIEEFLDDFVGYGWSEARGLSAQTARVLLRLKKEELSAEARGTLQIVAENKGKVTAKKLRKLLEKYGEGMRGGRNDEDRLRADPAEAQVAAVLADIRSRPGTNREANRPQNPAAAGVAELPEMGGCKVLLFYKPGCRECREAEAILGQVRSQIQGVTLERWNIHDPESMRRNEALCARFGVEDRLHLVAPAIIAAAGALVNREISLDQVVRLVLASREAETPGWDDVPEPELEQSEVAMRQRFAVIHVGVVLASGLLDGVNPCAFATVIFLLSYLQLRGHRRRHLWQAGTGFVLGVFVTYYLLGLGLAELVSRLSGMELAGQILRWSLVAMVAVLAILNLRDGMLCLQGRMGDMLLQLPGALKRSIRGTVRRGVRMTWLLPAALGMGALISVLELACTGQVYAPTILYVLRSGVDRWRAAWLLLLYNLAFVLPLVAVFAAALFGVGSAKFTAWLQRHAATVKFATAALFAVMLALMLR